MWTPKEVTQKGTIELVSLEAAPTPTFAAEFSEKMGDYLQRADGGLARIDKALADPEVGMAQLTRLFNEMTDISPDVRAVEFNQVMKAKDVASYAMQVTKEAGEAIFNDDLTDLKPEFIKLFPHIEDIKALCTQQGTTVVDMLLKGISALHSQCFADEITKNINPVSSNTGTNADVAEVHKMAALCATLQGVQVYISKDTLNLAPKKVISIEQLQRSLEEMKNDLYESRQLLEKYAEVEFQVSSSEMMTFISEHPKRKLYLDTLIDNPALQAKCSKFLDDYKVLDTQDNIISTAYESVFDPHEGNKNAVTLEKSDKELTDSREKISQIEILTMLKLMDVLKIVEAELNTAMAGLLAYNGLLLASDPEDERHERAQIHESIGLLVDQQKKLMEIIPSINTQNISQKISDSIAIISSVKNAVSEIGPSKPTGLFAPLIKVINKVAEKIVALFSPAASHMVSLKHERKEIIGKMLNMKDYLKIMQQDNPLETEHDAEHDAAQHITSMKGN